MHLAGLRLRRRAFVPLLESGLAVGAGSTTQPVTEGSVLDPHYRVIRGWDGADTERRAQQRWLAAGSVPTLPGEESLGLVEDALLDLYLLTRDHGVTIAGWAPVWHYVWPRDAAFVVSAFSRTGHLAEACRNLEFLQDVQAPSGLFEARYGPQTQRAPDARPGQLDGSGWALWALSEAAQQLRPGDRPGFVGSFVNLLHRSTATVADALARGGGLPPPGPDYWEVREKKVTLATCAVLLAGLQSAQYLYTVLDAPSQAAEAGRAADALAGSIRQAFGRRRYPRHPGDRPRTVDLGVSFLSPPFARFDDEVARRAWASVPRYAGRPAGGLAPGGGWRNDGISWTPTVATYALAAAHADPPQAVQWLRWLATHRTSARALPEKVLADGSPASVAPLAWTAAAVVITADELARRR